MSLIQTITTDRAAPKRCATLRFQMISRQGDHLADPSEKEATVCLMGDAGVGFDAVRSRSSPESKTNHTTNHLPRYVLMPCGAASPTVSLPRRWTRCRPEWA